MGGEKLGLSRIRRARRGSVVYALVHHLLVLLEARHADATNHHTIHHAPRHAPAEKSLSTRPWPSTSSSSPSGRLMAPEEQLLR